MTASGVGATMERTELAEAAVQDFRASLRGELLCPGAEGYDTARRVFNAMIDRRPAMIARCAGAADVISAVNFARTRDLPVAVALGRPAPARAEEAGDQMIAVSPETLKFTTPANFPNCVKVATLRGDPTKGPSTIRFKTTAGCRIPWHWHTPSEQVMMVSGTGVFEMKDAKPLRFGPGAGGYVAVPGHHVHRMTCTTACTSFGTVDGVFDIHYVDDAGKEIPADQALRAVKASSKPHQKKQ